jgi:ABC-type uncharacterized transport system permease subunit
VTTETRHAFKTTEFWVTAAIVVGLLIAAAVADGFGADQAWLYVTIVASAYVVSRGLAKAGSYEFEFEDDNADGVR